MSKPTLEKDIFRHLRPLVAGSAVALAYMETVQQELAERYERLWFWGGHNYTFNDKDMRKYREAEMEALHDVAAALLCMPPTVTPEPAKRPELEKAWVVTLDRRRNGLEPFAPTQVAVCTTEEEMRKAVVKVLCGREEREQLTVRRLSNAVTVYANEKILDGTVWITQNGTMAWTTDWMASAEEFPLNEVVDDE
ncbi:hypothetical protein [Nonomuraea sp. SYSU D8015]|uniref:hypothetical protein n=1 Tax=Nonomuraea sp. SYSU D8015 TaxID=2593644 RepID=UPI0016602312|nr:hypothetical protein [Nonomuraea sp. SYSU D8015]